jgi:subtilase family protein
MGSGRERARTSSGRILRPGLLLSAALAALMVAVPTGGRTSALAMNLGSGFAVSRFNNVPHTFVPSGPAGGARIGRGPVGATTIGNGRVVGVVGRGDPGKGLPSNPCISGRYSQRCGPGKIANNGGDHPGGGDDSPRRPHGTIWTHPPHWIATPDPILPVNPAIVTTQPTATGNGSQPQGLGPQAVRRSGTGVPPVNERSYRPDEVVVELAASASNRQTDALTRKYRLSRLQSVTFGLGGTTLMRLRITDRRPVPVVVRALETDATVLSAQPNYVFALQDDTGTPPATREGDPGQYMLDKMHLPQAHELARGNKVLVAVIDSGIDVTHPDLAGDIAGTFDAIGAGLKTHPHGTAIAGAIAAHGRLMGAAPSAQILAVRAFGGTDGGDEGTTFAIMSGLNWAVFHGARVINMSFAGPQDPGITRSLAAAHDRGVVLVAAAGNKGAKSPPLFPAADPNVIAVTATDANDQLPEFANRGRYVAVAAPGVDLMLLAPNGALQFSSGTSFSAAYVTGTVALMLERKPGLGPDTLRQALIGSAHRVGTDKATDDQSGAGLVDAYQAVLAVMPAPIDAANVLPAAVRR